MEARESYVIAQLFTKTALDKNRIGCPCTVMICSD
jgi:hypothetical protein